MDSIVLSQYITYLFPSVDGMFDEFSMILQRFWAERNGVYAHWFMYRL
jgi:hypothetical protein